MPITLSVNNELNRQQHKPTVILCESREHSKVYCEGKRMMATPAFCRHPGDLDGCRRSLIQALSGGSISRHCIIEGLRVDLDQCRQVLLEGLYDKASQRKGPTGRVPDVAVQKKELSEACKQVVLLGYPLEIKSLRQVFYEAYYRLVRSVIYRFGITDDGQPSADDVFQKVFLGLHKRFLKGASIEVRLSTYIERTVVNACIEAISSAWRRANLTDEGELEGQTTPSTVFVPPGVVENWEHLDYQLLNSDQGNLINRTILAHHCMEACSSGKKPSIKLLMEYWQSLLQLPHEDVASLHEKTVTYLGRFPARGAVYTAADLVNLGLAKLDQVAVVFAASTGMELKQIWGLIDELNDLSAGAIYTRISRIYAVLQPPEMQEH